MTGRVQKEAVKSFTLADRRARFEQVPQQTVNQGQSIFGAQPPERSRNRGCGWGFNLMVLGPGL